MFERRLETIEESTRGLPVLIYQVGEVHEWVKAEREARLQAAKDAAKRTVALQKVEVAGRWQFKASLVSSLLALLAAMAAAVVSLAKCAP